MEKITIIKKMEEMREKIFFQKRFYINLNGGEEFKIEFFTKRMEIKNLNSGWVYKLEFEFDGVKINNPNMICHFFLEDVTKFGLNDPKNLEKYLYFSKKEMEGKEFTPFFKEISGELSIKVKNDKLTIPQIKKILHHVDTVVEIKSEHTDDYAFDAANNFSKGKKVEKLELLEEIEKYKKGFRSNSIFQKNTEFDLNLFEFLTYTVKNEKLNLMF